VSVKREQPERRWYSDTTGRGGGRATRRVFEPGSRTYRWVRGPARADLPALKL